MKNPKFLPIIFEPQNGVIKNIDYLNELSELLWRYRSNLFDDFANWSYENRLQKTIDLVNRYAPAFWVIVEPKTGELAGAAYLYDWRGNGDFCYSACVSTCFKRKFWGGFARRAGKLFIRYVCHKFRLVTLRAEVFEKNTLVRGFLKRLGFVCCGVSRFATVSNGKIVDTVIFGRSAP